MKIPVCSILFALFITAFLACSTPPDSLYKIMDAQGNIGFIDNMGKVIVEPQFQYAGDFIDGIALVRKNNEFGYMDSRGTIIVPLQYKYAGNFSEGFAVVGSGTFHDSNINNQFQYPPYSFKGKFGYIDKSGKLAIPFDFGLAREFSEGLAVIGKGSLYYEYKKVRGCNPYLISRRGFNGKFGYIDKSGAVVIPPLYDEANSFSGGLALVKQNGKFLYIDKKGKIIWTSNNFADFKF